ncbi:MAG: hypothetical protein AMXMBFR13_25510 [Phycisphaerae bacterium]|jgi:hypothetical protein
MKLVGRMVMWLVPGSMVLGTSCGAQLKDSVVGAGVDFVGQSVLTALEILIPVEDIVAGDGQAG